MNIVMTGATGFVGSHLLPALAQRHRVHCLARDIGRLPDLAGVEAIDVDLETPSFIDALPAQADVILHLAQGTGRFPDDADHLYAVNLASTQRLASYAVRAGVARFVFASSGSVYRKAMGMLDEASSTGPADWYAYTKLASEELLACYDSLFEVAILRLFAPYGTGQRDRLIPSIIERVREGRAVTINGVGYPLVNPIHIDDLVKVLVQALEGTGTYTVNVAGPETLSISEIAMIAGEALGCTPRLEAAESRGAQGFNLIADTRQMASRFHLGDMTSPRKGIRSLVESGG